MSRILFSNKNKNKTNRIRNCVLGGPVVITMPHMFGAAAEYQTVKGIHPDANKHTIFADIEPVSDKPKKRFFIFFVSNEKDE